MTFAELTKDSVPKLWEQRNRLFKEKEVSLSRVNIDSAGLAFLVCWSKQLGNEKKLILRNASDDVKRLINIFNLSNYFKFDD